MQTDYRRHLLVTGSMRSGTTYVGKVLAHCPSLFYLHEPFNAARGVEGVEHWLPYSETKSKIGTYGNLVDRLMALKVEYKNPNRDARWRQWAREIIGSRSAWRVNLYKWFLHRTRRMLVKDPTAVFLSDYMIRNYDMNVVLMVRHPAAFYYSNKRLGWDFDLENITSQSSLVTRHLADEKAELLNADDLSYPQRIALLWRVIYRVANNFMEDTKYADRWIISRHEDICREPKRQFSKIAQAFGYEMTDRMNQYIDKTTSGNNPVSADANRAHQVRRDSSQLSTYWKTEVSQEEVEQIRPLTEPLSAQYYDDESWKIKAAPYE